MLANINVLSIVNTILIGCFWICCLYSHGNWSVIFFAGGCLEYFLQSACPCLVSLIQSNLVISIGEFTIICYFTDYCVSNGKLTNLFSRNFQNQIAEAWCKEVSWIQIMLDLHAHCISKCHLADCCRNTVTVKCISGNHFSSLHIIVKLLILLHNACIVW